MEKFKSIDDIKTAVAAGKVVCWRNISYQVVQDGNAWFVQCDGHRVPLSNGYKPEDFFIRHMCERCEENSVPEPGETCWQCDMDLADKSLDAAAIYREGHMCYPVDDWIAEVQARETQLGYQDWLGSQIELEREV